MKNFDELPPVSDKILASFDAVVESAETEVAELCSREDVLDANTGLDGGSVKAGMKFVSGMLRASMRYSEGEILNDELEWGRRRLPFYNVTADMVLRNLERYQRALASRLSDEAFEVIRQYLDAMVLRQRGIASGQE
jgi:hypothetical protein